MDVVHFEGEDADLLGGVAVGGEFAVVASAGGDVPGHFHHEDGLAAAGGGGDDPDVAGAEAFDVAAVDVGESTGEAAGDVAAIGPGFFDGFHGADEAVGDGAHAFAEALGVEGEEGGFGFLQGVRWGGLGVLKGGDGLLAGFDAFAAGVVALDALGILFPEGGGGDGVAEGGDDGAGGGFGDVLFEGFVKKGEVNGEGFVDEVVQGAAGDGALGGGEPFFTQGHDHLDAGLGI